MSEIQVPKVDVPNLVAYQTTMLEWYVIRCISKKN